ncbi:glutamate-rich protein 3-like [Ranitomeya imitator]|uniref:glutamate-rich protein 3-like n=1 Tax=Ranitomeya imitator TaxID=111125 RepID=UPI0037E7B9D2
MGLQYLGTGFSVTNEIINPKDEFSMFQQICGGESICIYKGYLSPGGKCLVRADTFHIISRRHYGFPFSASIYINGLIAARISWCCEYRQHVGFKQGRRGCFRITQLSGGQPCYRCVKHCKKYQIKAGRKQSASSNCEGSISSEQKATNEEEMMGNLETNTWEPQSLHSTAPNTRAIHPERRRRTKKKKPLREEDSDSEQENQRQRPQRRKGSRTSSKMRSLREQDQTEPAEGDHEEIRTPDSPVHRRAGAIHTLGRNKGSTNQGDNEAADTSQTQGPENSSRHVEEKDTEQTIHRLVKAISEWSAHSEVELSDSSESNDSPASDTALEQVAAEGLEQVSEVAAAEGLVCQIVDLMTVLKECDEVDHLVLRNIGLTDALLHRLAPAISTSKSEVENINLNLNEIGPEGAKTIVRLLGEKPCVKSLLLYGNQLGAVGIRTLMAGLSDLWHSVYGAPRVSSTNLCNFHLSELDIGGNQMDSEGLRSVASFLKLNPPLRQLCLAQSSVAAIDAWAELFNAMKVNTKVIHLLLDENSLGDPGAKLLSEVIQVNQSLQSLDLDGNEIGEEGGHAISQSLHSSSACTLINISLENNSISAGTMEAIKRSLITRANRCG